ncbi:MAG: hypothetical protein GEU28_00855 [Dehalococcoidia bacterium]|nr:hypothetical protein [Dehalococcoidia bacterium]
MSRLLLFGPALVCLLAACGDDDGDDESQAAALDPVTEITIVAQDIDFDIEEFKAPTAASLTITVVNEDENVPHNIAFYTDDSADEAIDGASTELEDGPIVQELVFTVPAPGEYYYHCDAHPVLMRGTLIVE